MNDAYGPESALARLERDLIVLADDPDDPNEGVWWKDQERIAINAFKFWRDFLGAVTGPSNDKPLAEDAAASKLMMCIIRAISWVESKHGHDTSGSTSEKDPMQCGNPRDSYWKSVSGAFSDTDFIRRRSKPQYYLKAIGAALEKNADFPALAKLSFLGKKSDIKKGHNNPKFNNTMSNFWAVLLIFQRVNRGNGTYRCGVLDAERVVKGAVRYNAKFVKLYERKIRHALDLSGCSASVFSVSLTCQNVDSGDPEKVEITLTLNGQTWAKAEPTNHYFKTKSGVFLIENHKVVLKDSANTKRVGELDNLDPALAIQGETSSGQSDETAIAFQWQVK